MRPSGRHLARILLLLSGFAGAGWLLVDSLGERHLQHWLTARLDGAESNPSATADEISGQADALSPTPSSHIAGTPSVALDRGEGTDPAIAAAANTPTQTPLSLAEARSLVRERRRHIDCQISTRISPKWEAYREQNEWRWLPADQAEEERQSWRDAIGRLSQDCSPLPDDPGLRLQQTRQRDANLRAAAEAGDLLARFRLERMGERTPESEARVRALLYDMLLSGDPEVIAQIGGADWWLIASDDEAANSVAMLRVPLWQLLACDLGLDCRQGSVIFDRECTQNVAACSSPDLAASLRQRYPDVLWDQIQALRGEWLQRIRSGQIAGLFDPPPNPPPGGP